ncbi:neurogenic locus delta protein [Culex quinquefasciatus]|uniref:Neurogenic locus delta protein n=1 Tax=Culex quinquefasciatus TaxID=7176 RepID=B0XIW7_CULQU|nr:neurogenic locus delta protein [Culex quinquefasciatus]|eukprot:XP_001869589.1 neurogenic locus delta protein [Culex quinquefasciatus]
MVLLGIKGKSQTECSGLFELKLKYFNNERGVDNEGACCSGRSDPVSGNCIGACKTRFRACLKHYQAKIDPSSPCTFGNVITPVLEGNSLNLTERSKQVPFENPIRFPFEFGWPGTFTLIVEAWLDTNETTSRAHGTFSVYVFPACSPLREEQERCTLLPESIPPAGSSCVRPIPILYGPNRKHILSAAVGNSQQQFHVEHMAASYDPHLGLVDVVVA